MNVVFFVAHPDDEAYGPAAAIAKFALEGSVHVVCLCNGDRPGSALEVSHLRQEAFARSCNKLGATFSQYRFSDASLDFAATLKVIEDEVARLKPEVVFTHNISDLHKDHRIVSEAVLVACRPKPASTVKALLTFEIPASTEWAFNQIHPVFAPNVFVDVEQFIDIKKEVMGYYASEVHEFPDARSIESMVTLAKSRGKQSGAKYAEAFQLIFTKAI